MLPNATYTIIKSVDLSAWLKFVNMFWPQTILSECTFGLFDNKSFPITQFMSTHSQRLLCSSRPFTLTKSKFIWNSKLKYKAQHVWFCHWKSGGSSLQFKCVWMIFPFWLFEWSKTTISIQSIERWLHILSKKKKTWTWNRSMDARTIKCLLWSGSWAAQPPGVADPVHSFSVLMVCFAPLPRLFCSGREIPSAQ